MKWFWGFLGGCVLGWTSACVGDSPPTRTLGDCLSEAQPNDGTPSCAETPFAAWTRPDLRDPLILAGSGAMVPLFSRLAQRFGTLGGPRVIVIPDSLGSGGGVRAAWDGAIDVAMMARPLTPAEAGLGLLRVAVARDIVLLAAHPEFPRDGFSAAELPALFVAGQGVRTDNDNDVVTPLLRDRAESANAALDLVVPGLETAREQAYASRRLRVLYSDQAMAAALLTMPGRFGVFSKTFLSVQRLPLKTLQIDGVVPSSENVLAQKYKAVRDVELVFRQDRATRTAAFVAFLRSDEARSLLLAMGCLLPTEKP